MKKKKTAIQRDKKGQGTDKNVHHKHGFVISMFFFAYFTIKGQEYRSLYQGLRHIEVIMY